MKRMLFFSLFLVVIIIGGNNACTKDKTSVSAASCPDTISFANQVKPIIDLNCATSGCHNSASSGGYNLTTYSAISANANIILSVIKHESGVTPMPFGGAKLADSLIQQFECWVIQGKLEN
jgi:hypothetical protein